jgi:hypothetical protein
MTKKKRKKRRVKTRGAVKENVVRPEMMAHVRRSIEKNRKLLELFAK